MIQRIHHITLVVRDLDAAAGAWQQSLALGPPVRESLPERGVRTARFRIGETLLVLVEPTDARCAPGQHLASHGEGILLLSFEVSDLAEATQHLVHGGVPVSGPARVGLEGWRVQDFDAPRHALGSAVFQLSQARPDREP